VGVRLLREPFTFRCVSRHREQVRRQTPRASLPPLARDRASAVPPRRYQVKLAGRGNGPMVAVWPGRPSVPDRTPRPAPTIDHQLCTGAEHLPLPGPRGPFPAGHDDGRRPGERNARTPGPRQAQPVPAVSGMGCGLCGPSRSRMAFSAWVWGDSDRGSKSTSRRSAVIRTARSLSERSSRCITSNMARKPSDGKAGPPACS
jgi:hypothetical protein